MVVLVGVVAKFVDVLADVGGVGLVRSRFCKYEPLNMYAELLTPVIDAECGFLCESRLTLSAIEENKAVITL